MKRICFLVDSIFSIGGVQRVTAVIAKELARDYIVTIVTRDDPQQKDTTLYGLQEADIHFRFFTYPAIGKLKNVACKLISGIYQKLRIQSKWFSDLYAHSSFPSEQRHALALELQQGHYDIIIGVHAPLAARLATIKNDLPHSVLIGWIHNSFEALFDKSSLYIGEARKRHYVYQFRKLHETIVLCQHDVQSYNHYDEAFTPKYIYNPLTIQPGIASNGQSKRFLAIGRFSHLHKGFDILIEAFHLFAKKDKEWILDIVGEGEEKKLYQTLIDKYDLGDRVLLHPFTNHVQTYYSQAQIYVLSSRWEGFGLVLVEAMSHGLPVISSNIPTSHELLGDFGIFFKNGDIIDLSSKLEEATHLNWQEKSRQAIEIAHRFDLNNIITQWKQLLNQLSA